jgi:hypothetical protein
MNRYGVRVRRAPTNGRKRASWYWVDASDTSEVETLVSRAFGGEHIFITEIAPENMIGEDHAKKFLKHIINEQPREKAKIAHKFKMRLMQRQDDGHNRSVLITGEIREETDMTSEELLKLLFSLERMKVNSQGAVRAHLLIPGTGH